MSVEAAIHERWGSDGALTALVPAERLLTGAAFGQPAQPYVVLHRVAEQSRAATSSGTLVTDVTMRFDIFTRDFTEATNIAAAIAERFERAAFPMTGGSVLAMRRRDGRAELAADDVWRIEAEYLALTQTSFGD